MPDWRLYWDTQYHESYGRSRKQPLPSLSLCTNTLCCWERQAPSHLENKLSTGTCNGKSHRDEWVSLHPWVRENYSISIYLPASPNLSPYVLPPTANTCGMPKQVKILKQSTSVSSRPGEHILSPLVHSFGCHLCALHLSGGHYSTYRTTLTKFIQQALNDSQ